MAKERIGAVKPTYKPIKTSEVKPVGAIYMKMLTAPGVVALLGGADPIIDTMFVTHFQTAIDNVGNIVPSKVIIKTNKDITKAIKDLSKKSVKYGMTLTVYLKKAYPNSPGKIESFPIVEANDKMRNGETEGLLDLLNTINEQITASIGDLTAPGIGYPLSNQTDYKKLYDDVFKKNDDQEAAKKLVPENTDAATLVRNTCYSYIQTLLTAKDIAYYEDKAKRHEWAVTTQLNQMRSGGNS